MNPFDELSDADLVQLSIEWLAHRPGDAAGIIDWQRDVEALRLERERRRGDV